MHFADELALTLQNNQKLKKNGTLFYDLNYDYGPKVFQIEYWQTVRI